MKLHAAIVSVALALTACGGRDQWQVGTHYALVQPSTAITAADGTVTVLEFFWYGSPHCYTLDPHLALWNRRQSGNVEFRRVPTTWGQYDRPHARLFYTLEVLGRSDLHALIFDTIHARGNRLADVEAQRQFVTGYGIDEQQFLDAYHSTAVTERVRVAEQLLLHYRVDKLPTLIVNGKYKTDLTRTERSGEQLMRLISDLATSEATPLAVN